MMKSTFISSCPLGKTINTKCHLLPCGCVMAHVAHVAVMPAADVAVMPVGAAGQWKG